MGYDSYEVARSKLDGSMISTYVLIMLIVPMKIACRISKGINTLGWDDAFVRMARIPSQARVAS